MLTIYHDDAKMQNGNNGGKYSSQIIPHVVQPDRVEKIGLLVLHVALNVVPT